MSEWSEDHVTAICSLNTNLDKLETGRDPYVESGDHRLGRSESGMWQADTSMVIASTYVG
jgi:hypothetical protein